MSDTASVTRRRLVWIPQDESGIEDVRITHLGNSVTFNSMVIRLWQGLPLRVSYELVCDADWRVREIQMAAESEETGSHALHLLADGAGDWQDATGGPIPELQGCIDVDFMLTPLTNTLPIRRLALTPGESREISVVYIAAPDLALSRFPQRYTRLEDDDSRQRYRYESLVSGFTAVLPVDDDGFVVEYPGQWRRIWPSA